MEGKTRFYLDLNAIVPCGKIEIIWCFHVYLKLFIISYSNGEKIYLSIIWQW